MTLPAAPSRRLNPVTRRSDTPKTAMHHAATPANRRRGSVLLALAAGTGITLAAEPQFSAPTDFAVGHEPRGVVLSDLNRDGKLDIVTADFRDDQVSVLLGQAGMTYAPAVAYPVGSTPNPFPNPGPNSRPWNLAAGDVNNDGKPDVVTVNCNSLDVSVLLGNGLGGLGTKTDYAVSTTPGACPQGVAIADLNRDGRPDLAVAVESEHAVKILLGTGAGAFGPATAIPDVPASALPVFVAAADINRDGILDLLVTDIANNAVHAFRGAAGAGFSFDASFPVGNHPTQAAVADLDRDGNLDLVTTNEDADSISVLIGQTGGSFGAATEHAAGNGVRSVSVADVNADGALDIVAGNGLGASIGVLAGNGDGSFQAVALFAAGAFANGVAVADLNRDGRPEVVVTSQDGGSVGLLTNLVPQPNGGNFPSGRRADTGQTPSSVVSGDIDRDGIADAITANKNDNTLSFLKGSATGTFGTPSAIILPAAVTAPTSVALGDVNRDGKIDLAVGGTGGIALLRGNGDGTFTTLKTFLGRTATAVAIADLDSNGIPDIAATNPEDDTVTIIRRWANGNYRTPVTVATGDEPVALKLADLNRDGLLDMAIANKAGNSITRLLQGRNRVFQPIAGTLPVGNSPQDIEAMDFNGDGLMDIAVVNHDSSTLSVLLRKPGRGFRATLNYALGVQPTGLALADVNRDGVLDAVIAGDAGLAKRIRILRGRRDGQFLRTPLGVGGANALSDITTVDANGDGAPDIVAANGGGNAVSTFLNQ